jgi:N-acyl-D-aspartate/D-glutamate deacylase
VGQCGLSPAPLLAETREEVVTALNGFFGALINDLPWQEWASVGDYLHFLTRQGVSPNLVPLVGQGMVRAAVMGFGEGRADRNQPPR